MVVRPGARSSVGEGWSELGEQGLNRCPAKLTPWHRGNRETAGRLAGQPYTQRRSDGPGGVRTYGVAVALLSPRKTGACHFSRPSVLFGLDHPSHYLRRIKLVSVPAL